MQNMILATGALSDAATITGASGLGDLTIDKLKRSSVQEFYRINGGNNVIDVDLGSAKAINVAALIAHNASALATCQVTAGNTVGAATFDTGPLPMQSQLEYSSDAPSLDKNLFFQFFSAQTYRYWRFTIIDPSVSYLEIGRLYLSNAFQPDYNMAWGKAQGYQDLSSEFMTVSADSISLKRPKRRVAEFSLDDLSEGEAYGKLMMLDKLIGTTGDVLYVPFPDNKNFLQLNAIYGKISELQSANWTQYSRFKRQYRIMELVP